MAPHQRRHEQMSGLRLRQARCALQRQLGGQRGHRDDRIAHRGEFGAGVTRDGDVVEADQREMLRHCDTVFSTAMAPAAMASL